MMWSLTDRNEKPARSAADILWRRSKLGLRVTEQQAAELDGFVAELVDVTGTASPAAKGQPIRGTAPAAAQ